MTNFKRYIDLVWRLDELSQEIGYLLAKKFYGGCDDPKINETLTFLENQRYRTREELFKFDMT